MGENPPATKLCSPSARSATRVRLSSRHAIVTREMALRSVAVIGAGTMGHGIAQVCAMSGLSVRLIDVDERSIARGMAGVTNSLGRFVRSGKMTQADADGAFGRIATGTDLEGAVGDVDVAIEAVPEILDLKKDVFRRLAVATRSDAVLGTNTSQFSVTGI